MNKPIEPLAKINSLHIIIRIQLQSFDDMVWIQVYFSQFAVHTHHRRNCTTSELTNQCATVFSNDFPLLFCIRHCAHSEGSTASLSLFNSVFVLKLLDLVLHRCVMKTLCVTKLFTKLFMHYVARIGLKIE